MKHFDHIVFDVDGTLADTEESVLSSLGQIVQEETGKTLPRHELEFALGIPGKDALEKLGIYSQATLDRWCQVAASFKSTISVFPGLLEVIATLADSGCKLGIVSSRARDEYAEEIAPFGFDKFFGHNRAQAFARTHARISPTYGRESWQRRLRWRHRLRRTMRNFSRGQFCQSSMGITPRYPKRHLQPQNPQRPTNPNNQITHASHPFSPNATRAIEQDGLGGSRT